MSEISMPMAIARQICEMERVCFGEGQGADNGELMHWIAKTYPELVEEFSYLPWNYYMTTKERT